MGSDSIDEDWEPDEPTRLDSDTIVVPLRMYKGITVFSTLLATLLVVLGFFLFDAATQPSNLVRGFVVWLFQLVGYVPPPGVFDVGFGLLGVASILLGAGSYILGSRFKTADMVRGDAGDDGADEADAEAESDSEDRAKAEGGTDSDDDLVAESDENPTSEEDRSAGNGKA